MVYLPATSGDSGYYDHALQASAVSPFPNKVFSEAILGTSILVLNLDCARTLSTYIQSLSDHPRRSLSFPDYLFVVQRIPYDTFRR